MVVYVRPYPDGYAALARVKLVKSPKGETWTLQVVFTKDGTNIATTEHFLLASWQVEAYKEIGIPVANEC
jgi:hypothetical protein